MYEYLQIENIPIIDRIKKTKFKKKFENLVDYAAPILNSGPELKEIGFTPHDFSHHIRDIYLLLSKMIPEQFYINKNYGENLFVLLTAALFHDIGMTKEWSEEVRQRHSQIGRDIFLKPFKDNDVSSVIKLNVDGKYSNYIGDIIYAHSDIKIPGTKKVETFCEICNKYENIEHITQGESEIIDVPFLAALLRLADEMDISYERIENIDYLNIKNLPASMQHFRLCELVKEVQVGKNFDTLVIIVDEDKCNFNLPDEENKDENLLNKLATDAANILERYDKIKQEFKILNERVLRNTSHASADIWKIRRIELENEQKLITAVKKKEYC